MSCKVAIKFVFLVGILIYHKPVFGQINDSTDAKSKKVKVLPVPTIGYEPETKTQIGAVCLFTIDIYQDSLTRVSNAKVEFNYTFRNQIILETQWSYFFRNEKWFSDGIIHLSKYPDFYYGVGSNSSDNNEILYESNRLIFDVGLYKNLKKKLFFGGGIRYLNYFNLSTNEYNPYNELKDFKNIGLTTSIFFDSRNNLLNSTKGSFLKMDAGYNTGSNDYFTFKLDLRKYFTFKYGFILASRFYNSFVFNTPNFYDYSILGGDKYVRGYFYGKYRDNNLSTIQAELRTPLLWRFGLAFIVGASTLYSNYNDIDNIRSNYGLGLRFLVDKKDNVNLRFDYVLGNENNSGFYIGFGESF